MRSKLTIVMIVVAIVLAALAVLYDFVRWLGFGWGLLLGLGLAAVTLTVYRLSIQPWQHRWGATDDEVARAMPGDEIIPDAASTTRAITIHARPEQIWPWLVQLGFGRAGWYSYDWIDNDGHPSADRIQSEHQHLEVGDQILMVPGMGPRVRAIEPNRSLLCGDQEGGTWCLGLYPDGDQQTRLVSRWRVGWTLTPATAFWILLSDPGAFIMERRMLMGIRQRAERAAATVSDDGHPHTSAPPRQPTPAS
jgi:hypothetical protein